MLRLLEQTLVPLVPLKNGRLQLLPLAQIVSRIVTHALMGPLAILALQDTTKMEVTHARHAMEELILPLVLLILVLLVLGEHGQAQLPAAVQAVELDVVLVQQLLLVVLVMPDIRKMGIITVNNAQQVLMRQQDLQVALHAQVVLGHLLDQQPQLIAQTV